ncbi:MAG: hypothetical protein MUE72_09085, partial [Chitinophagaceae bacterium]|jgi:hypothetical protein|nr:hypothetical protein [Chitinophagaceae bacterium]
MSWDIVIFSSKQKIDSIEEINEELFEPIDFNSVLEKHFDNITVDENHRKIKGDNYSINYFVDTDPVSNILFNLSDEASLFELIRIAKIYGWQIFDTGNGQMIDLENPENNGYHNFKTYLRQVLKNPYSS